MGEPLLPRVGGLLYGGDYSPEQWPEETWLEDADLMQEAGVNLVSVGIFSWAELEPEPGAYRFEWLDRVLETLWSRGIAVDLATPSAAPPAWLVRNNPEILPVTADGVRLEFGSRRHACPSSPVFRDACVRIDRELAGRYAQHPALAMWHVSNEFACHLTACYCDVSAEDFRQWLRARYDSIGALNSAWATAVWGQRYGDWSEIAPPRRTPASVNPSHALDWLRFSSDAFLECYEAERQVLTEAAPEIPVTTNFMSLFQPIDHWKWATREDVVTIDSYPDPAEADAHVSAALNYDLMRGLANGESWLLLEHATSAVNWRDVNVPKRPGLMRLWAHQAIAHGSDGVMFFQWRASRAGTEKFHSGMVPHLGRDGRVWADTVQLGAELRHLSELAGTTSRADVAILLDWESWWALDGADHPSRLLELPVLLRQWYGVLHAQNVPMDFAHPAGDLDGYRLVIAPNLHLVGEEALRGLRAFAERGGVLVVGPFSLVVDPSDRIRLGSDAAEVRRLLGLRVDEFWPLLPGDEVPIAWDAGRAAAARLWTEWLLVDGAETVASYAAGPLATRPAVTRNTQAGGAVYYCSAALDEEGVRLMLEHACGDAGVEPLLRAPAGVEVRRRAADDRTYLFALNHTDEEVEVNLLAVAGTELLSGAETGSTLRLGPLGVAVVRERR